MIKAILTDGDNSGSKMKIQPEGTVNVVVHPHPPPGETLIAQPFRAYFTTTGVTGGSNDMTINGASTNVEFYITANTNYDTDIKSISMVIGDGGIPAGHHACARETANGLGPGDHDRQCQVPLSRAHPPVVSRDGVPGTAEP